MNMDDIGQSGERENVQTALYIHPDWELAAADQYVYQFRHQQLPGLGENQIAISALEIWEEGEDLIAEVFLRNTLEQAANIEGAGILLLDSEENIIAEKHFEWDETADIPSMSSMPWRFRFEPETRKMDGVPAQGWKAVFEIRPKEQLVFDETWENRLSDREKKAFAELAASLPALSPGDFNMTGIEASFREDGSLAVVVLFRNGSGRDVSFEAIPLIVEDAQGSIVAKGGFQLNGFEVKAGTSKPWTFLFPASLIEKTDPDLSSWKAYPPKEA